MKLRNCFPSYTACLDLIEKLYQSRKLYIFGEDPSTKYKTSSGLIQGRTDDEEGVIYWIEMWSCIPLSRVTQHVGLSVLYSLGSIFLWYLWIKQAVINNHHVGQTHIYALLCKLCLLLVFISFSMFECYTTEGYADDIGNHGYVKKRKGCCSQCLTLDSLLSSIKL